MPDVVVTDREERGGENVADVPIDIVALLSEVENAVDITGGEMRVITAVLDPIEVMGNAPFVSLFIEPTARTSALLGCVWAWAWRLGNAYPR